MPRVRRELYPALRHQTPALAQRTLALFDIGLANHRLAICGIAYCAGHAIWIFSGFLHAADDGGQQLLSDSCFVGGLFAGDETDTGSYSCLAGGGNGGGRHRCNPDHRTMHSVRGLCDSLCRIKYSLKLSMTVRILPASWMRYENLFGSRDYRRVTSHE